MQPDTRKLLISGSIILLTGVIAALLMFTAFGGISKQGPHTDSGWLALMAVMGCVPAGLFTLVLGFAKLIGDRHRS